MKKTTKLLKPILSIVLIAALLVTSFPIHSAAAGKVKLNKTNLTLPVGKSQTLKLKNNKKKVTWSSNKKKVATVTKKGKVTAKKKGTATITAKVGKKKYKCKVTVTAAPKQNNENTNNTTTDTTPTTPTTPDTPTTPTTPTPPSETEVINNYAKLKSYIQTYGTTNSSGNKFIKYFDNRKSTFGIVYDSKNASFSFMHIYDTSATSSDIMRMDIKESDLKTGNMTYLLSLSSDFQAILTASGNINTLNATSDFNWSISSSVDASDLSSSLQDLANSFYTMSYFGWNTLLNQTVGLSMTDLGFAS